MTEFTLADFPLVEPGIVVFGNVAPITQGKTQASVPLGNGDSRQIYQSFQLPKAPLTWLSGRSAHASARSPKCTILVNEIEWTEVDSLFASGPKDQVYILREDNSGNTWVQFGDGVNGAALPSGVNNVTAQYRTGNGANGWRQSGTKPQPNGARAEPEPVRLYDEVTGRHGRRDPSHMRQTAPGRVKNSGAWSAWSDFEFEALALPGVEKAQAVMGYAPTTSLSQLTVLLSDNTASQLAPCRPR